MHQRVCEAFVYRVRAPRQILGAFLAPGLDGFRQLHQPLAGVGPAIEHDVLDVFAQRRFDVLIDAELPGVDDAHRQSCADRVVKEHRVDRLAHMVVAAKRERNVRHAATDLRVR
jgi:hypothetical protein